MEHSGVKTIEAKGFKMDYFYFGTGERKLVIIPGVSMQPVVLSADAVSEAYKAFANDFTVYLFDRKHEMQAGYDVYQMAEDTAEAMRLAGIVKADIFGASQGGMIAQIIALNHPELLNSIYLASTLSRQSDTSKEVLGAWCTLAECNNVYELNHHVNTHVYGTEYYEKYKDIFDTLEHNASAKDVSRFLVQAKASDSFDVYNRLKEIRSPVFVAASVDDRVTGYTAALEIAEALSCPFRRYEGYGHAVYDECPEFGRNMLDDLKSI